MRIDGLPEGIELVRYGVPAKDEFYFNGQFVAQSGDCHCVNSLIARPSEGYRFVPMGGQWGNVWTSVKDFPEKEITVAFRVSNTLQEQRIRDLIANCGFPNSLVGE